MPTVPQALSTLKAQLEVLQASHVVLEDRMAFVLAKIDGCYDISEVSAPLMDFDTCSLHDAPVIDKCTSVLSPALEGKDDGAVSAREVHIQRLECALPVRVLAHDYEMISDGEVDEKAAPAVQPPPDKPRRQLIPQLSDASTAPTLAATEEPPSWGDAGPADSDSDTEQELCAGPTTELPGTFMSTHGLVGLVNAVVKHYEDPDGAVIPTDAEVWAQLEVTLTAYGITASGDDVYFPEGLPAANFLLLAGAQFSRNEALTRMAAMATSQMEAAKV